MLIRNEGRRPHGFYDLNGHPVLVRPGQEVSKEIAANVADALRAAGLTVVEDKPEKPVTTAGNSKKRGRRNAVQRTDSNGTEGAVSYFRDGS